MIFSGNFKIRDIFSHTGYFSNLVIPVCFTHLLIGKVGGTESLSFTNSLVHSEFKQHHTHLMAYANEYLTIKSIERKQVCHFSSYKF